MPSRKRATEKTWPVPLEDLGNGFSRKILYEGSGRNWFPFGAFFFL